MDLITIEPDKQEENCMFMGHLERFRDGPLAGHSVLEFGVVRIRFQFPHGSRQRLVPEV